MLQKGSRPSLIHLFPIILVILACQPVNEQLLATTRGTEGPGISDPTITPTPCLGCSRALPFAADQVAQTQHWQVQVLETMRGEDAWEALYEANYFNEPPPENTEYLLVKYRIENIDPNGDVHDLGLHITGSSLRLIYSFDVSIVEPEPILETELAAGETSEGWIAYRIQEGERNLIVVIQDLFNYDEPAHYLALEEGAAITISKNSLASINKTYIGQTLAEPALPGQISTSNHWQLAVDQVIFGDEAWHMAYETNQFNDPPPPGMHYIAFLAKVRYFGLNDAGVDIDDFDFELMNSEGEVFERPSLVTPDPELDYHFYPGGNGEGWVILQAPEVAQDIVLRFVPDYDENSPNTRYHSLLQYGR